MCYALRMDRTLTSHEKDIVAFMIEQAPNFYDEEITPEMRTRWMNTLDSLKVTGQCNCGLCPSIKFQNLPTQTPKPYALEATTNNALILLYCDEEHPIELEVAPFEDVHVPLPTPNDVTLHVQTHHHERSAIKVSRTFLRSFSLKLDNFTILISSSCYFTPAYP